MANDDELRSDEHFFADRLDRFARGCLEASGADPSDAACAARALVATELRGVSSHGFARLDRYVRGLRGGAINPRPRRALVVDLPALAILDADNGLGQAAGVQAMELAIDRAARFGVGVVGVRRSNHFGMAAYYVTLALARGMAGFATTNASPQVAPTFGAEPMFGTNPIAIGLPTGEPPFLLDMATSAVPRGKLERMSWSDEAMPEGWAIDADGNPTTSRDALIAGLKARRGHALLPLGGAGERFGGHKGFGLGLLVDLACGPLAGAAWGRHVYGASGADLGHWFGAVNVAALAPDGAFTEEAARALAEIRHARRAAGAERIFVAGEKEAEAARRNAHNGVVFPKAVRDRLAELSAECGVPL